jgi:hypothetical protein
MSIIAYAEQICSVLVTRKLSIVLAATVAIRVSYQANPSSILHFSAGTFSIDQEQLNASFLGCDQYQAWKYWESWAHLHLEPVWAKAFLLAVFGSVLAYKLLLTKYCFLSDSIALEISAGGVYLF